MLKLYNTLTRKVEDFDHPLNTPVTLYCCGPTVYDFAHIGNFRTYAMTDFLVRSLRYLGYTVKYSMNITDVGHLVSDADEGEDKLEKGARREGKTAWDIAKFYAAEFIKDSKKLNLTEPDFRPHATDYIKEQIAMVKTLMDRGIAYTIDDGIYFDTSKFAGYGQLTGQNQEELKAGARVEPNPQKKNPSDFALWKFSPPSTDGKKRDMEWESPWGVGFPGWHIECSAMSRATLETDQLDIHTGGADLIPVHHTNEIAQSEAATGVSPFVRYWVHGQFIMVDGAKMAKSKGNFYKLSDIEKKGFDPLALRYFYMTAHYRAFLNFTWEGLEAAQTALHALRAHIGDTSTIDRAESTAEMNRKEKQDFEKWFQEALEDDLNLPKAIAVTQMAAKSQMHFEVKEELLKKFDEVLGLDLLRKEGKVNIPNDVAQLVDKRTRLRDQKQYKEADDVRKEIESKGYIVEDSTIGIRVKKKTT